MVPDRTFQSISSAASRVLPLADLRHLSSGTSSSSRLADFDCARSINSARSKCMRAVHRKMSPQLLDSQYNHLQHVHLVQAKLELLQPARLQACNWGEGRKKDPCETT